MKNPFSFSNIFWFAVHVLGICLAAKLANEYLADTSHATGVAIVWIYGMLLAMKAGLSYSEKEALQKQLITALQAAKQAKGEAKAQQNRADGLANQNQNLSNLIDQIKQTSGQWEQEARQLGAQVSKLIASHKEEVAGHKQTIDRLSDTVNKLSTSRTELETKYQQQIKDLEQKLELLPGQYMSKITELEEEVKSKTYAINGLKGQLSKQKVLEL